jgi:4-hydroxybenzoyl-CoA thioesterase
LNTATPSAQVHRFERPLTIRFSHCDPAGIVFFPQYLVMVNNLVEEWVSDGLGVPYAHMISTRHIGMPTVSLNCEFTAVSRMGDEVMMGLSIDHIGRSSLRLNVGCRRGLEARFVIQQVLVTTDLQTHRPIAIPDDMRSAMVAFQAT